MEARDWATLVLGAAVAIVTGAINRAFGRLSDQGERLARLEAVIPTVDQALDRLEQRFSEIRTDIAGVRSDIHALWERISRE